MNQSQIRELYKQFVVTFPEAFAEYLIEDTVRKCCQHLTNIGQDYAREQLERHFGVEE